VKKLAFILFISPVIIFSACNKEDSSNSIENQIENCEFENPNANIFFGNSLLSNSGVFIATIPATGEISNIRVVSCDSNKFHDISFKAFNEGGVIEDGVYNASEGEGNITVNYVPSKISENEIPPKIFSSVDGIVEINKGEIIFNVICQNIFTTETIKLSGDIFYL